MACPRLRNFSIMLAFVAACTTPAPSAPTFIAAADLGSGGDLAGDAVGDDPDATAVPDAATDDDGAAIDAGADVTPGLADAVEPDADAAQPLDTTEDVSPDAGPLPAGTLAPCDTDDHCTGTGTGKKCHPGLHACVGCLASADCGPDSLCQANACVKASGCKSDTDCKASKQVCAKGDGVCVDCDTDADCTNAKCQDHACVPSTACKSSKDCPAICDQAKAVCVTCLAATDCAAGETCLGGACVAKLCSAAACAGGLSFACKADGSGYGAGKGCDDGDACSEGDGCAAGVCKPGPAKACDDGNPCTTDGCDAKLGCTTAPNTVSCNDNDPCTEVDACTQGKCAGKAKFCDDGKACTADACQGGSCVNTAAPGPCSDGTACTENDLCDAGTCKPGKALQCDDGNPCTIDACDPIKACTHANKTGTCDDGNDCTSADACVGSACVGIGKQCVDGNPCTDDKCSGGVCSFVSNAKPCDDGDGCTSPDACVQGKCVSTMKDCNDGNPCTSDGCSNGTCMHGDATGTPCEDGDPCTKGDACTASGTCKAGGAKCDDGDACTLDTCKAGTCSQVAAGDGAACGAAGSCDVCQGGKCQSGGGAGLEDTFGGSAVDKFNAVLPVQGGGWLLVGSTASKGAGYDDGWVVRVDAGGNVMWEKTFGGTYIDTFNGGVAAADGTFTLVGTIYSSTTTYQAWLLRLDATGKVLLEKTYGTSNTEYGESVAANAQGWLLSGMQAVKSGSSNYNYGWVLQLDAAGEVLWQKQVTSMFNARQVVPVGDQLVIVGQGSGSAGGYDMLVQRLKPGGSQVWSTAVGGSSTDTPRGLLLLKDGTLAVTGKSVVGSGAEQPYAARLDADGKILWKWALSGLGSGELWSVIESGSHLVAVGQAFKQGVSTPDGLLAALATADGTVAWSQVAAPQAFYDDALRGIAATASGYVAVGNTFVANGPGSEGWLLHVNGKGALGCACTGLGCDDGKPCTTSACYLGLCKSAKVANGTACSQEGKPGTCDAGGACVPTCGNGQCNSGENSGNCPADCKPLSHPCDSACGGKSSTYSCYCDAQCKSSGDCCTSTGGKAYSCSGSTCSTCK